VYFLHDLIPLTHPEYCRAGEVDKHRKRLHTMLTTGHGVIANSHSTLQDLIAHARSQNLFVPPYLVAHLGIPAWPAPLSKPPTEQPYFVVLSTIEARKNHLLLLHVWRSLVEKMGAATPKLVIIGQRGWECEQVVDLLERCEALHNVVTEVPRCEDAQLATWLKHAQALLFPSFAEGFGLPLVEALAQGVPVIASQLPAFKEVAGDIPDYLDPLDGVGWLAAVQAYTDTDHPARQAQLARLQGFRPPSWEDHFTQVEMWLPTIGLHSPVIRS
jgi:glycosyltransferase involved in cell wall biosynthesis